jgi:DNA (cytosine-5)-methyltransferase 1
MTFYEFFAGGGMARAGLGANWTCLLANDNDRAKAASYAVNWGRSGLAVDDIANLTAACLPDIVDLAWGVAAVRGRQPGRRPQGPGA